MNDLWINKFIPSLINEAQWALQRTEHPYLFKIPLLIYTAVIIDNAEILFRIMICISTSLTTTTTTTTCGCHWILQTDPEMVLKKTAEYLLIPLCWQKQTAQEAIKTLLNSTAFHHMREWKMINWTACRYEQHWITHTHQTRSWRHGNHARQTG